MQETERRRRNRSSLSCDRCRKMKRKCNREIPCSSCTLGQHQCLWDGRLQRMTSLKTDLPPRKVKSQSTSLGSSPKSAVTKESPSTSMHSTSDADRRQSTAAKSTSQSPKFIVSSNEPEIDDLKAVLDLPGFANVILTIWFRDLDYMYDILGDSEFERQWRESKDGIFDGGYNSFRFGPILLAVCAVVCQLNSTDLEAAILAQGGEFVKATWLGRKCWDEAGVRIDNEYSVERCFTPPPLEHFQASLIRCAYSKNTGNRGEYHDLILRDISRLQRRGMHRQCQYSSLADETLANRIFWAYFTYDRLYLLMEGLPYAIGASHADVWLQDDRGTRIHVQDLCSGVQPPQPSTPAGDAASHMSLSVYVTSMAKLAAAVGRYTDCICTLRHVSGDEARFFPEAIATHAGQDFSNLEQEIHRQLNDFTLPQLNNLSNRVKALHHSQQDIISMCIAKSKSIIATRLIEHLDRASVMSTSLQSQKVFLASKLLQLALQTSSRIPLRQMAWGFFLFYTFEPIVELFDSLKGGNSSDTNSIENLSSALSGRNLIVMVARETKTKIAVQLADRVCASAADTLMNVAGMDPDSIRIARDVQEIVKVQKTVESYRACLTAGSSFDDIFNVDSFFAETSKEINNAAMMQALKDLVSQMANPVLT